MSSQMKFPSPVGGIPFEIDQVPSALFASLYGILVVVGVFRFSRKSTRTFVALGNVMFAAERVAVFSIRAIQSQTPSQRTVHGLLNWEQATYAVGYASLLTNAMRILQSLVVNTTKGEEEGKAAVLQSTPDLTPAFPLALSSPALASDASGVTRTAEQDMPETRARYRQLFALHTAVNIVGVVLAITGGNLFAKAETDAGKATFVRDARFIVNAITMVATLALQGVALWAFFGLPRIRRKDGALLMLGVGALLHIITIYRYAVFPNTTSDLLSRGPGSLNMDRDKVLFYVFHVAPEFLAAAALICVDVRGIFGTGLYGDRLWGSKQ